jgi:lipopolysaccharide export system protein LptA
MRRLLFLILIPIFLYSEKVEINADHFFANDIQKIVKFKGNATIRQGENFFRAEEIIVYFNKKRKAKKYEAIGNVRFDITENGVHYRGRAQKIVYSPNSSKYYFYGDVVLEDLTNKRKIEANSISLDLKTGLADIKGKKNKPVHFIFEIEDRK